MEYSSFISRNYDRNSFKYTMKRHDSMRGYFAYELYRHMKENKDIILLTGDLGYGMFDQIKSDIPEQFINCGASEQAMMGIAVGLTMEGKITFVYSITTFLLYRPFETIRNYIDHEKIPVKLIASGRGRDYEIDGFSHWSEDCAYFLQGFGNISEYWPSDKSEIPTIVKQMIKSNNPEFLSLRR